eukprot:3600464-Pyramimonas_sp.AAC.1
MVLGLRMKDPEKYGTRKDERPKRSRRRRRARKEGRGGKTTWRRSRRRKMTTTKRRKEDHGRSSGLGRWRRAGMRRGRKGFEAPARVLQT